MLFIPLSTLRKENFMFFVSWIMEGQNDQEQSIGTMAIPSARSEEEAYWEGRRLLLKDHAHWIFRDLSVSEQEYPWEKTKGDKNVAKNS
jgi:hypothetical protein